MQNRDWCRVSSEKVRQHQSTDILDAFQRIPNVSGICSFHVGPYCLTLSSLEIASQAISFFWQRCNHFNGSVWEARVAQVYLVNAFSGEVLSDEVPNGLALCISLSCNQKKAGTETLGDMYIQYVQI